MSGIQAKADIPLRLIIFDGVCNLCNGAVQFVITHDPAAAFTFTALQSDTGQQILRDYDLPSINFESFIYIRNGILYQRSTAALYVLKDLGGIWGMLYAFIIIPRPIRDAVYDLVARYRYRIFGKRETCMIPTPDLKKRFL
jgi:predicted DCC family thiol-disulfide oxidoreductase YuxK